MKKADLYKGARALTSLTDCESSQKLVQQFLPSVNSLFMLVKVAVLP